MLLSRLLANSKIEYMIVDESGRLCRGVHTGIEIEEIFCDSRQVVKNGLYVAIDGLHTDSHIYISDAVSHGAKAAIVSRSALIEGRVRLEDKRVLLVCVDDCREAFARIYAAWYSNPQDGMTFIGVTGTNGKTTVCRMIFEILSRAGHRCGLVGTAGNMISASDLNSAFAYEELDIKAMSLANMTTPDPPELYRILERMRERGVRYVIMEVTSHALALKKVAPISFEIGVFTNLSEDHLDFHSSMEEYYEAKKQLFSRCNLCVVNIDDRYGRRLSEELEVRRYTCSSEGRAADYNACDIRSHGEAGMEYRLASGRMRLRVRTGIPGAITVMNTMQAAAVCNLLEIPARSIKDSIASIEGVKGRLEKLRLPVKVGFSVYVDYAHTPDALENLLRTAKMFSKRGQRIVLVFGCGGDRERQKRAMMGHIAASMADFFVVTSDNPRGERPSSIIDDIVSGIGDEGHYTVIEDRESAIEYVIRNARSGDVILLAGKGHEEYQIKGNTRLGFSEREIVDKYVKRYFG
ncbi:MAG: UDP-N-acetylmuramoyl-L-alanyl-D-glutamate--2,6-diaminopimelate ligase [Ruminococcaceae bacterium]|nr:UDP-N-acetylmuramoyl-L-alanyl-D-glutamate--2,6-diaminopimelate ligase [Oscillospiraceae bacterium]